jgi:hypothetical protein
MGVEAPDWQGVETQEYLLYFKFSQRSQAGWIGAQKCEFILKPPLYTNDRKQTALHHRSLHSCDSVSTVIIMQLVRVRF